MLRHYIQRKILDDKALRHIFQVIDSGKIMPDLILFERAAYLASAHARPIESKHQGEISHILQRVRTQHPKMSHDHARSLADMEPSSLLIKMSKARIKLPKLYGPHGADALARTLERRGLHGFATETRRASKGVLAQDPLILSMIRRIDARELPGSLDALLLQSALALSPESCLDALALGACAHRAPSIGIAQKKHALNVLGALLCRQPENPIAYVRSSNAPSAGSDEQLAASCALMLASCPTDEWIQLASLRPLGPSKHPAPDKEAFGLALNFGLLSCARLFFDQNFPLGSNAPACLPVGGFTGPRRDALSALATQAESKLIAEELTHSSLHGAERSAMRL